MKLTKTIHTLLAAALSVGLLAATPASACTRCLRVFSDGTAIVARSMDWVEDPGSEIWVFPRGMKRSGNAGPTSLEWTSKHGSVGVSFYGVATVDGINEQGVDRADESHRRVLLGILECVLRPEGACTAKRGTMHWA